jgi:hypothetical protein
VQWFNRPLPGAGAATIALLLVPVRSALATVALALVVVSAAGPAADASTCTAGRTLDRTIPTWSAVNHFTLGSHPATDAQIGAYIDAVDRASTRVTSGIAGRSVQGRPIPYAVITAPGTPVAAVDAQMRQLRDGADSAARAHAIAASDPALVAIAGSIHSNEPSGADADMRLLYELAARRDCDNARRLRRLIVTLLPIQNPDGRAAGTRVNANNFDLNRDWFAATQPETQAKLALLEQAPPLLYVDQHEQGGTRFFFPPNADPVNHELPTQALAAIHNIFGPQLRRAFNAHHYDYETDGTFDLFYPGFGDSGSTLIFGAAGMTFEAGSDLPFARRVAEHFTAANAALDAAARHRGALLRGWADEWLDARAQGAAGQRQPNRVIEPHDHVAHVVPSTPVYGYALADGPDTRVLLSRLAAVGVTFGALTVPLDVGSFVAYGTRAAAPATLPAGTVIVSLDQTRKHWIEALLDQDPFAPIDRYYDISAFSQPLTLGIAGGAIQSPLPAGLALAAPAPPAAPTPGAPAYAFDGSSLPALAAATALLREGVAVRRDPATGALVVSGDALDATLAATRDRAVTVRALQADPATAVALRPPRVAVLADDPSVTADPTRTLGQSSAWARFVIGSDLGMPVDIVTAAEIAAGALTANGDTAFVVPDGPLGANPAATAQAVQAWVRGGGTFVGERTSGITLAGADGLSSASTTTGPTGPGAIAAIRLAASDPLTAGLGATVDVTNVSDPIIAAATTAIAAAYPAAPLFESGDLPDAARYASTPAVLDQPLGAGHVVLFGFDPAFRADSNGASRLLGSALLLSPSV